MPRRFEDPEGWNHLRQKILGLGEDSIHKSHFAELHLKIHASQDEGPVIALTKLLGQLRRCYCHMMIHRLPPEDHCRLQNQNAPDAH